MIKWWKWGCYFFVQFPVLPPVQAAEIFCVKGSNQMLFKRTFGEGVLLTPAKKILSHLHLVTWIFFNLFWLLYVMLIPHLATKFKADFRLNTSWSIHQYVPRWCLKQNWRNKPMEHTTTDKNEPFDLSLAHTGRLCLITMKHYMEAVLFLKMVINAVFHIRMWSHS